MTLLYKELKVRHSVKFYGFKRQYPAFFFPGKTDKDVSSFTIMADGVERILDSLNPMSWWRVFKKVRQEKPDMVIFSWWVSFWAPQFWTISLLIKKFTTAKILFICHNVIEHESHPLNKALTKLVLKRGDYFVVHSSEDLKNLKELIPSSKVEKTYHPSYSVFNYKSIEKEGSKKLLNLEGKVLLFFGFVRPYKGLKYAIEAMPLILKKIDVTLLIVGEFWADKEKYLDLIKEFGLDERIRVIDKYVANEEVGLYFSSADLVLLPYINATGSGIVQIAYAFDKPVIASKVGCLPEVVSDGRTGYLVSPGDPEAIAEAVVEYYKGNKTREFAKNIEEEKEKFSWGRMVGVIESFCEGGPNAEQ